MANELRDFPQRTRNWLRRFWQDLIDRRTDISTMDSDGASALTVEGAVALLVGGATQVGALTDWADRLFLELGDNWALVSKIVAQIAALLIAYRVISKTKTINPEVPYSIPKYSYLSSATERLGAKLLLAFVLIFSLPSTIYREILKGLTAPLVMHVTSVCRGSMTPLKEFDVRLRDRSGRDLVIDPNAETDERGVINVERQSRWPIPYVFVFHKPDTQDKEYVAFFQNVKASDSGVTVEVECKGEK